MKGGLYRNFHAWATRVLRSGCTCDAVSKWVLAFVLYVIAFQIVRALINGALAGVLR